MGELGKIMGLYQYYLMREGKGMQEINTPTYDNRMWNDDGSIIKAPTIKGIVDVGVSIAALTVPGGTLVAASLNLADDALFDLAGVAGGYLDGKTTGIYPTEDNNSIAEAIGGLLFGGWKAGADVIARKTVGWEENPILISKPTDPKNLGKRCAIVCSYFSGISSNSRRFNRS